MTKFSLTLKLKQHTPMIHFQHDQSGATLRATELKPKLDKYLKTKYPDMKSEEKGNFDYKVKIKAFHQPDNAEKMNKYPLFFGNMGVPNQISVSEYKRYLDYSGKHRNIIENAFIFSHDIYTLKRELQKYQKEQLRDILISYNLIPEKRLVYSNSLIVLDIFSFKHKILEAIENSFADFLLQTNFGTRQSKGFGSFYIDKSCDKYYKKPDLKYKFTVNSNNYKDVFSKIELFYNTLRSGINKIDFKSRKSIFYFKSLMFLYAKSKGIQWEKKSIKEKFFNKELDMQKGKHKAPDILTFSSKNKKLMKDLLGLSTSEQWSFPYRDSISKEHINVERFQSPLFFKPIMNQKNGYDVFFYGKDVDSNMLGESFTIKNKYGKTLQISTPSSFDINDFLNFAFKVDLRKHVHTNFYKVKEFIEIEKIYNEIKSNI